MSSEKSATSEGVSGEGRRRFRKKTTEQIVELVYEATDAITYLRDPETGHEWSTMSRHFRENYEPIP